MAKQTFTTGQVLTAAQMTSLQQTAMGGGSATAKTASYTLVAADAGGTVAMNAAGATTITVDTSLFAAGDTVYIQNLGAGVSTITAGTATVNTSASLALAQYEGGQLYFTSTSASIFIKGAGATASAGGLTLISQYVANAESSIVFSSISGSYKQLLMMWSGIRHSAASNQFGLRFNNDSATNYYLSGGNGLNTTASYDVHTATHACGATSGIKLPAFGINANNSALEKDVKGMLLLDNYASTTKGKSFQLSNGFFIAVDSQSVGTNTSGYYDSITAITSLDIVRLAGSGTISNATNTTIRLYGVN